jgi:hypothetical protein
MLRAGSLRAVQMTQGNVGCSVKHTCRYGLDATDLSKRTLGLSDHTTFDKGMGRNDPSRAWRDMEASLSYLRREDIGGTGNGGVAESLAGREHFAKRESGKRHWAMFVLKDKRGRAISKRAPDQNPSWVLQRGVKANPVRSIVVASNCDDSGRRFPVYPREKIVEELNRILPWYRAVEEVSRDDQRIDTMVHHRGEDLLKQMSLIIDEAFLGQGTTEMPI